jgi:hypothetical protein
MRIYLTTAALKYASSILVVTDINFRNKALPMYKVIHLNCNFCLVFRLKSSKQIRRHQIYLKLRMAPTINHGM